MLAVLNTLFLNFIMKFLFPPCKTLLKFWGILDTIWGRLDVEKAGEEIKWGKYSQLKIGMWSETSFLLAKTQSPEFSQEIENLLWKYSSNLDVI